MVSATHWTIGYALLGVLWLVFAAVSDQGPLVRGGWLVGGLVILGVAAYVGRTGRHPLRGNLDGDGR
jgi:hypothetical protein